MTPKTNEQSVASVKVNVDGEEEDVLFSASVGMQAQQS